MDGIDVALVDLADNQCKLIKTINHPWPTQLKKQLKTIVQNQSCNLSTLGELDSHCGDVFAYAVLALLNQSTYEAKDIIAIGSHGQTLCHAPLSKHPYSTQIGDPNRIVEKTKITTVADFRRSDIAAGGQGAPLVPAFHQEQFIDEKEKRIVLNIGGIANISILNKDKNKTHGFDTGPGNCLLDYWVKKHQQLDFDENGNWASSGKVNQTLLNSFMDDSFFKQVFPKSTGTEYFSGTWLQKALINQSEKIDPVDVQATLLELTALSISHATSDFQYDRLLVCGGGIHNSALINRLKALQSSITIESTYQYGIDPDWVEAIAFAWLAKKRIGGEAGNLPSATGARRFVKLGAVYSL